MKNRRPRIMRIVDLEKRAERLVQRAREARNIAAWEHFARRVVAMSRLADATALANIQFYRDFD